MFFFEYSLWKQALHLPRKISLSLIGAGTIIVQSQTKKLCVRRKKKGSQCDEIGMASCGVQAKKIYHKEYNPKIVMS
jgi:hypothetical protein